MTDLRTRPATPDDLLSADGKFELINGQLVEFPMAGDRPGTVAEEIFVSLRAYARQIGRGVAHADGVDFVVNRLPSGRQSFRPDASYHLGPRPANRMKYFTGAPTFAVEVRSEHDYGPAAEADMAAKRADYFAAGTLAVWDVDPLAETVRLYTPEAPTAPTEFHRGQEAHAEPAAPGWRLNLHELFA
jgi:Uma2 family endonuclease